MAKKEIDDAAIALKKEKERVRMAAYRAANPEKVKAALAKYRAANREKIKEIDAKYYAENREKIRASRSAKKAKAEETKAQ